MLLCIQFTHIYKGEMDKNERRLVSANHMCVLHMFGYHFQPTRLCHKAAECVTQREETSKVKVPKWLVCWKQTNITT